MTRFDVIMTSYYCNYPKFKDILLQRCNTLYNGKVIERWTEGCILPFPKKGDLGLAKKLKRNHTYSFCTKNLQLTASNRIQLEVENVLRRKQNGFRKKEVYCCTNPDCTADIEDVRVNNL